MEKEECIQWTNGSTSVNTESRSVISKAIAEAALKRARHVRDTNRANIQRAKETVITSVVALRQFIGSEIGGEVIRDERANIDQQTSGQRVSAR